MKRRWTIKRRWALGIPPEGCQSCDWFWVRTSYGGTRVIGCVGHHSWTRRVRAFVEVPDATE